MSIQKPIRLFYKEVKFFDNNFKKAILWYKSFFPTIINKFIVKKVLKRRFITGEVSPYNLLNPHAPRRVYQTLPNVKIMILLRNPVYRTYSGYHHSINTGREYLPFEEAGKREVLRIKKRIWRIKKDEHCTKPTFPSVAYKTRSI